MKYASYVEHGVFKNARFELGNALNRDDSNYPFWLLRERFLLHGIELNTPDINAERRILFELHMNVMQKNLDAPAFVLLMETAQICPLNASQDLLASYRRVFTWRDDLVDQKQYIKINFPNKLHSDFKYGWGDRDRFCCLIAGNKSLAKHSSLDLYSERVKTIRWFEHNASEIFDLFGTGWEAPPPSPNRLRRLWHRIVLIWAHHNGYKAFPSYKGKVLNKSVTLRKYRFAVCYENVKDLPGYITEKIFDCFFAGCIPIYWGASNISNYVPRECFIDRREFDNHEVLYRYLINMTEVEYKTRQNAIQSFLTSTEAKPFFTEFFVDQITSNIISALNDSENELV